MIQLSFKPYRSNLFYDSFRGSYKISKQAIKLLNIFASFQVLVSVNTEMHKNIANRPQIDQLSAETVDLRVQSQLRLINQEVDGCCGDQETIGVFKGY